MMDNKRFITHRLYVPVFVFLVFGMNFVTTNAQQRARRRAVRQPTLAQQLKQTREELAKANERAQRAEETATAARAEADRAKAEANELNKNVTQLNGKLTGLEEKLNKALTTIDSQQQKSAATDQKVADVSSQVAAAQADIKKTQSGVDQVQKETKGAITSANAKMSVYGFVLANSSFGSSQLNIPDIPLWAVARESFLSLPPISGQTQLSISQRAGDIRDTTFTMRQSRFGFRASLPKVGEWTPSAQVEVDFFGARPVATQGTVFNQPRIRLGYLTLEHTSGWKIVAGQDWMIFAPLNPTSFAHFAIPEAATAGNPWMRLPQLRVEKTIKFSEGTSLLWQGGFLRAVGGGDSPAAGSLGDLPTLSGERAIHPFYQTRFALTTPGAAKKPLTIGASGHYGRKDFGLNTIDSWGVAIDYVLPLHSTVGLSGEVWTGSSLDSFQAGILQGAAVFITSGPGGLLDARFKKINASGGWIQLGITPTTKWALNLGYGQDDPRNRDLNPIVNRSKNQVWWTNIMYKIHPNVTVALEYNFFDTIFRVPRFDPRRVGTANYVNLAFVYSF